MRARAYAAADAFQRRALAGLQSLHQGWWLGLLERHHLNQLPGLQYPRWPRYTDDGYNASGLLDWEDRAIRDFFPASGSVLVGAAGGGRETIALARRGYSVDAFDCVGALAESSRALLQRLGITARVFLSRPGEVPDGLGSYDGVIVGWGGYIHIPGRENRIAFLKALRQRIGIGAPLLLSFLTRPGPSRRLDWTYRIARAIRRMRPGSDPVEYGDTLDGTFDHLFTRDEVSQEMSAAGFELLTYAEAPYGHAVGRAIAVVA